MWWLCVGSLASALLYVQASSVNVREAPSESSPVLGQVPIASACEPLAPATADGWIRVRCGELTGAVKASFLGEAAPRAADLAAELAAVPRGDRRRIDLALRLATLAPGHPGARTLREAGTDELLVSAWREVVTRATPPELVETLRTADAPGRLLTWKTGLRAIITREGEEAIVRLGTQRADGAIDVFTTSRLKRAAVWLDAVVRADDRSAPEEQQPWPRGAAGLDPQSAQALADALSDRQPQLSSSMIRVLVDYEGGGYRRVTHDCEGTKIEAARVFFTTSPASASSPSSSSSSSSPPARATLTIDEPSPSIFEDPHRVEHTIVRVERGGRGLLVFVDDAPPIAFLAATDGAVRFMIFQGDFAWPVPVVRERDVRAIPGQSARGTSACEN